LPLTSKKTSTFMTYRGAYSHKIVTNKKLKYRMVLVITFLILISLKMYKLQTTVY